MKQCINFSNEFRFWHKSILTYSFSLLLTLLPPFGKLSTGATNTIPATVAAFRS